MPKQRISGFLPPCDIKYLWEEQIYPVSFTSSREVFRMIRAIKYLLDFASYVKKFTNDQSMLERKNKLN